MSSSAQNQLDYTTLRSKHRGSKIVGVGAKPYDLGSKSTLGLFKM